MSEENNTLSEGKKKKRIQAVKATCFFVLLVGVLAALYFATRPAGIPGANNTFRTYELSRMFSERDNSIDVVYVGHSSVYFGVSPMEIYGEHGIAGYDVSQALLLPWETYRCLKDMYKKQRPRLVMLEVDQFFYDTPRYMFNSYAKRTVLDIFPFYESHLYWRDGFGKPARNPYKAYVKHKKVVPFTGDTSFEPTDEVYKMHKRHKKFLRKIMKLCAENGSAVAFFEVPSKYKYTYAKHNCAARCADEYGVKFLDMNLAEHADAIGIDWQTDTHDGGNHLNHFGAVKATRYLGGWIKANFELPDRRGDGQYSDWEDDLKKYREYVADCTPAEE